MTVDCLNRQAIAKLPLVYNAIISLSFNKDKTIKAYNQQLKKLNNHPSDKEHVIKSEKKISKGTFKGKTHLYH